MKIDKKQWINIFFLEICIGLLYEVIGFISNIRKVNATSCIFAFSFIIYSCVLFIVKNKVNIWSNHILVLIRWIGILYLPIIFEIIWLGIFGYLVKTTANIQWLSGIIFIIAAILYIFMFLPIIVLFFGKVRHPWMKMIAWLSLLPIMYGGLSVWHLPQHPYLTIFMNTGALGAIAFAFAACTMVYEWNGNFNPNLKLEKSNNFSYVVLFILIGYAIINIIWMNWGSFSFTINKLLNFKAFSQAFEVGILEEMCRYLTLIILFQWFHKQVSSINWIIFISSALFSLQHLSNLLSQSLLMTFEQMIVAFGYGLFYSEIFLYSGKIWIPMLLHGILDYSMFTNSINVSRVNLMNNYQMIQIEIIIVAIIVPILITIWMLNGKGKTVLQAHLKRLGDIN